MSPADVTAVVLAGGLGTRLRDTLPGEQKAVADVAGQPMLSHLLTQLDDAGVRRAVIGVGHLAEQVMSALGSRYRNIELIYSVESEPLGTAGALRLALPEISGDVVLVMNGDSFAETHLPVFFAAHSAKRARASILLTHADDRNRYGSVETTRDGEITAFHEKRDSPGVSGGLINAGVYLISREIIAALPSGARLSLEKDLFPDLVGSGAYGIISAGRFLDIGTPESYAAAEAFFRDVPVSGRAACDGVTGEAALVDRDGTIIYERHYLSDPDGVELLPSAAEGIRRLRKVVRHVVVITNQAGVGRGMFPVERVEAVNQRVSALMEAEGAVIDGFQFCPHTPWDGCECRKPAPGLAYRAAHDRGFDVSRSVVIGDNTCDFELADRLGVPGILVASGCGAASLEASNVSPAYFVSDLAAAAALFETAA